MPGNDTEILGANHPTHHTHSPTKTQPTFGRSIRSTWTIPWAWPYRLPVFSEASITCTPRSWCWSEITPSPWPRPPPDHPPALCEDCSVIWTAAVPGLEISASLSRLWLPHGPGTFVLSSGGTPHLKEAQFNTTSAFLLINTSEWILQDVLNIHVTI